MFYPSRIGSIAGSLASVLLAVTSCNQQPTTQAVGAKQVPAATDTAEAVLPTVTPFGQTKEGIAIKLYTLRNAHGLQATISTYGGTLTSLLVAG